MSTATAPIPIRRYANGADWWHDLGDVPLERIVFDPLPGTVTEEDFIRINHSKSRAHALAELVDGTLVEKTVGAWESIIAIRIAVLLTTFVRGKDLGWVIGEQGFVRTTQNRIRMPDSGFVAKEQAPLGPNGPAVCPVSPALVVEVLSEGNTRREMDQKRTEYFASGTRLLWMVDPTRREISVFDRDSEQPSKLISEQDVLDGGDVLPGLRIQVAELFAKSF